MLKLPLRWLLLPRLEADVVLIAGLEGGVLLAGLEAGVVCLLYQDRHLAENFLS